MELNSIMGFPRHTSISCPPFPPLPRLLGAAEASAADSVTQKTPLLVEGRLGVPKRKINLGCHSQTGPAQHFLWFCLRYTRDLLGQLHQPLPSAPLRGPAQVPEQPAWSCLPQPRPCSSTQAPSAPCTPGLCSWAVVPAGGPLHLLGLLPLPLVLSSTFVHSSPGQAPVLDT